MVNKADRARQFLPFDALKGYKEAIMSKRKVVLTKKELSEDEAENLSYKFNQIQVGMMVKIIYFENNEYISMEGMIAKLDLDDKYIQIVKTKINIDSIVNISGKEIKDIEVD
jgi:hypothetical protein